MGRAKHKNKEVYNDYISIEEFAKRYKISPNTIIKKHKDIPGIMISNGQYWAVDSARYPYNPRNSSLKTRDEKMYVLLKATREYRYIDNKILGISKQSFDTMIKELLSTGLIQNNNSGDINGANSYDLTMEGSNIAQLKKTDALIELSRIIGAFVGTFVACNS